MANEIRILHNDHMSRRLEQRSLWRYALIWWVSMMAIFLGGMAILAALRRGAPVDLASVIWAFCVSTLMTVVATWRRQQREDAKHGG